MDTLEPGQFMYRMYAKTFRGVPSAKLQPISNYIEGRFKFPSLQYLGLYRVLVCTINTAWCLTRARRADTSFNSRQYSHIIIDEAASVQMTVALVAIAGKGFLEFLSAYIICAYPRTYLLLSMLVFLRYA